MKVLLIEDDARMAEDVVQALGSRGHLVKHILDGDRDSRRPCRLRSMS